VVDTGSTDDTRAIARAGGARLHEFAWCDDFAAARNHALDLVRGQWILYIDADERIAAGTADGLRAQLDDPSLVAGHVLLHPRPGFTGYWEMRMFRNDPGIRFHGAMHESIWPGIHARLARKGGRIERTAVVLDHLGYEGDQRGKHARDIPLLEKALAADPDRVYCWWHLGRAHMGLGDERAAERAWTHALALARRVRGLQRAEGSLPFVALVQWRLDKGADVEGLLEEALARFPLNAQLHWLRGRALMAARRHEEAIGCFERLVEWGRTLEYDRTVAYDARLFGRLAWESLAACHFALKRYGESRRYFDLILGETPDSREHRLKRELCDRLARAATTVAAGA
jgi:hypothetical protein